MPTYTYRCECGVEQEKNCSLSERTDQLPCECGKSAEQVINWRGDCTVKGNQRPMKLDPTCMPIGWERGNVDAAKQERRYDRLIRERKKRALEVDSQAIKNGFRHIASVPRELQRLRSNQYGKDYFDPAAQSLGELKAKLKADDLLFKN